MSVRVEWDGLSEFQIALLETPANLTRDARPLVEAATAAERNIVYARYPGGGSGNLRARVRATITQEPYKVIGVMRSAAQHAHLYEWGTKGVRMTKGRGRIRKKIRSTGKAPPHPTVVPTAVEQRAILDAALVAVFARYGLAVASG